MIRARVVSLALLPVLLHSPLALAATSPPPPVDPSVFTQMSPGNRIRIQTPTATIEGAFEGFVTDTLWIAPASAAAEPCGTSRDSIQSVYTRSGSSGKGAKIGALAGATVVVAAIAMSQADGVDDGEVLAAYALGSALVIGAGALLGALIGQSVRSWHREYP